MRWRHATTAENAARAARLAWTVSFLATLTLVAVLAMAKSAQALPMPGVAGVATAAAAPPPDEELENEDEAEAEASEGEELEAEECEEGEEEECEEGAGPEAPRECLLSSAEATVVASPHQDRVRLLVRYTTSFPTTVAVAYGLHGAKGSLSLGSDKKHFAKEGVLHLTKRLTDTEMAKVLAAKGFTVRLHALAAPSRCNPLFDRQLDVRQATPSGLAWSESK
jgi:hypothetical protein